MRRRDFAWASVALMPTAWAQVKVQQDDAFELLATPSVSPAVALACTDTPLANLRERLTGRVSLVQLMFTGCSDSCPAQGLLFAEAAARGLPEQTQLVSLSIDALGDSPQSLRAWLAHFKSSTAWWGGVPAPRDVDSLSTFLRGSAAKSGTHTAQVFVFDAQARLRLRSKDMPSVAQVRRWASQFNTNEDPRRHAEATSLR